MARFARTLMTTKTAMMKIPDRMAETMVIAGETFLLPLTSSPMSLARLPTYTYSSVPAKKQQLSLMCAMPAYITLCLDSERTSDYEHVICASAAFSALQMHDSDIDLTSF